MFGGDPFGNPFEHMRRQMQEMDNMMNSMIGGDPFAGMLGPMMGRHNPMLTNGNHRNHMAQNPANMMLSPFGGFGGGLFGGLMQQMDSLQHNVMNDPNSTVFTQSTMISYDGNGQPRVVQSSTRKAGDAKETRHSVQNGDEHKMSIGHSIGDRTHIIEKKRDKDGRIRQQQKFVNLDEEDAKHFNDEFKSRVCRNMTGPAYTNGRNSHQKALEGGAPSSSSSKGIRRAGESSAPIVTVPDDDEDEDNHRHGRRAMLGGRQAKYDNDEEYVYSGTSNGPTIREISDEEEDMNNPKRRKGAFGRLFRE